MIARPPPPARSASPLPHQRNASASICCFARCFWDSYGIIRMLQLPVIILSKRHTHGNFFPYTAIIHENRYILQHSTNLFQCGDKIVTSVTPNVGLSKLNQTSRTPRTLFRMFTNDWQQPGTIYGLFHTNFQHPFWNSDFKLCYSKLENHS